MATKKATRKKKPLDQIFKLRISLEETDPIVWRQVLVPGHFTLEALHSVFQLAMGWRMSHLYDFQINKKRYADEGDYDDLPAESIKTGLSVAAGAVKSFFYNYDFGDSWRHVVRIEDVCTPDENFSYPVCIDGENACPPEDCGGFPGFEELKKKIKNPKDPEYDEILCWLGGHYNPISFDTNRINRDMLWMVDWTKEPNDQGLYLPFNFEDHKE